MTSITIPSRPQSLWLADAPLVLASASLSRLAMLRDCGVPVEAVASGIDERAIESAEGATLPVPGSMAMTLAKAKALDVSARFPGQLVLGADQTLTCDGMAYHKPTDLPAAAAQLESLSGREHLLCSGFGLARNGHIIAEGASTASMRMRRFGAEFIARYLAIMGQNALSSVGGYQIEGLGSQLFEAIAGDHFTILGLPLLQVLAALRLHGALAE